MSKITVKPGGDDRLVPKEGRQAGQPLSFFPKEPTMVELTQYIQRRLACGDLVEVKEAKEVKPAPAATPVPVPQPQPASSSVKVES